jgi:hypothetical protein
VGPDHHAEQGGEQLPDHGGNEHQNDRHERLLGRLVHQERGNARGEGGAHGRPGQEADATQYADDETLPVAGDRERGRKHDQDQIEEVSRHPSKVSGGSGPAHRSYSPCARVQARFRYWLAARVRV